MPMRAKTVISPPFTPQQSFTDAEKAYQQLLAIYEQQCQFITEHFRAYVKNELPSHVHVRGYYPQIRFHLEQHQLVDSRLAYGYATEPETYVTTVTRPELFKKYLIEQMGLLIKNHGVAIQVGLSQTAIPLHFCYFDKLSVAAQITESQNLLIRNHFDVPDLTIIDDAIVNGTLRLAPGEDHPLAPFTAPRVDYSLQRLEHYTATLPEHFQNFVIFTNYQFYVDEFCALSKQWLEDPDSGYTELVEPGNFVSRQGAINHQKPTRLPQMPSYHLKRADNNGITLVNIGVGPSNAKTITDHIGVLRPSAWIMLGHCAGLRNTQQLGDYVLAHGYVRDDHVLDADLPLHVPLPPLAEIQVALEKAVEEISGLQNWELKRIMRTGTVASIDNRNWELLDQKDLDQHLSQSRAIGLDMESATIAANGFRLRVPYGTLLCVSDKPLHGELKLPRMANSFYTTQINQHLQIGLRALEFLRQMPSDRLYSRKLRSFIETPFK
ncbi:AMP nucleosidase [Brackiella oedipodis]|uniref:AMP nucleosidase n=1 Tax=Brackiella oedipodis TaxID=124225 RepID=UPI0006885AF9|nr:AMP nucleosidase [Brackiella oedipodis]